MRLGDLQIRIGALASGRHNAITDVPGVRVGHARASQSGVGLSVIQPFADGEPRRTYLGRWALDGGDDTTGVGLAEDFGALSTPIVLSPAAAAGRVYDAMIQRGLRIDSGLSEDRGWPPAVLPIGGGGAEALQVRAAFNDDLVNTAFDRAATGPVAEGQVGIGRSLVGFGCAAGVGTASRLIAGHVLGAFVVVNGGEPARLSIAGYPAALSVDAVTASRPRSAAAVVVTDAPLLPGQLERVAGRGAFGLTRVGLLDEFTRSATIWALSTTTPVDDVEPLTGTIEAGGVSEDSLPPLFAAAADALEEAVVGALLAGATGPGSAVAMPMGDWPERIRQSQRDAE